MKRRHRYLLVVVYGPPLLLIRIPEPPPRWRDILRALTPVMHSYGLRAKDISSIEGLESGNYDDDDVLYRKAELAFSGDTRYLRRFDLYDWRNGAFALIREGEPR